MTLPHESPNDILNEMESVVTFLRSFVPDAQYERQNVPPEPKPNTFIVRFLRAEPVPETALSYVNQAEWQIVYIGGTETKDVADVLTKMNTIKKAVIGGRRLVIPILDENKQPTMRYMRVVGFSFGQPVRFENKNHACIGVLQTETRKARDIETYEKIIRVSTTITSFDSEGVRHDTDIITEGVQ